MKDDLIALMEAVRLIRAELDVHHARPVKNAPRTLARIEAIMNDTRVSEAMGHLVSNVDAPAIAPDVEEQPATEKR